MRLFHAAEVWSSNPGIANSYTVLQTVRHRYNILLMLPTSHFLHTKHFYASSSQSEDVGSILLSSCAKKIFFCFRAVRHVTA